MPFCFTCRIQYHGVHRCKVTLGMLRKCARMRSGKYYEIKAMLQGALFGYNGAWGTGYERELSLVYPASGYVYKPRMRRQRLNNIELWHEIENTLQWPTDWSTLLLHDSYALSPAHLDDPNTDPCRRSDPELIEILRSAKVANRDLNLQIPRPTYKYLHVWEDIAHFHLPEGLILSSCSDQEFNEVVNMGLEGVSPDPPQKSLDNYMFFRERYSASYLRLVRFRPFFWHFSALQEVVPHIRQKLQSASTNVV